MSDNKITEKITDTISETVTNVFKKSGLSDKLDKLSFYFVVPVVGIIICGFCSFQILSEQNTKNKNENLVLNSINRDLIINLTHKIDDLCEKISDIEKKFSEKLEKQQTAITSISELPLLNICKEKPISSCSSNISILMEESPVKPQINVDDNYVNNYEERTDGWIEPKDIEDDELINECYDAMPLNGVKKLTGIKSFLWYVN
jgi:hypothetical protein